MKLCLVAINSKYVHMSPAVDSLHAYSSAAGIRTSVCTCTVNQPEDQILGRLYGQQADALFFSVYIWNCAAVYRLSRELKKLCPDLQIWFGGPEVSFRSRELLRKMPWVRGVLRGEGEICFTGLARILIGEYGTGTEDRKGLSETAGITWRAASGEIFENAGRSPMDMNELVFPYSGTEPDRNRIYYYESSRGCPFGCSYCLSSTDRDLRFKSVEKTKEELLWFLENRVKQVKFVDRTFNLPVSGERALEIWKFLKEHDNGVTNFHFEICAELLTGRELEFLSTLRPGQVQFEIGVQSVNPATLRAIRRSRDENKLRETVGRLIAGKNIHIHLDLIAGLPYEDLRSFEISFDSVFSMEPLQLQLGFLKVLKGTPMETFAGEYGFIYGTEAPFEIRSTPWMGFGDILELKQVEEMVEVYYNSHQFDRTVRKLLEDYALRTGCSAKPLPAYRLFRSLALFFSQRGYDRADQNRMDRYRILYEFIGFLGFEQEIYVPLLLEDALARERLKHWPEWAGKRQIRCSFDYEHRDPLTGNAVRSDGN